MTYAFTFDASACTGCKACQIACKDKNNLPVGVLWRRVFEVSGGEWQKQGQAWENSVFAYHLSIACNHCVHPKCAGVCPTDAFVQREDGIVYIDGSKCMGCGYCAWACPYAVPQYHPQLGRMTKCNFCMDELDQGRPPACVAACPMRVLDFVEVNSIQLSAKSYQTLWAIPATEHPFPLPAFSRTQPHLAIRPHPAMGNGLEKAVANGEEVKPPRSKVGRLWSPKSPDFGLEELPLVAFTLLAQMAAGMAVTLFFLQPSTFDLLTVGFLLGLAGLASFLHLGTKKNAWRAVLHLQKSWLSREILMVGLFGAAWLLSFTAHSPLLTDYCSLPTDYCSLIPDYCSLITALLGLGLVYSMSQVYRLRAAPAWDTWRTGAAFFLSAGILGLTGVSFGAGWVSVWLPLWVLLALEAGLALLAEKPVHETVERIRGVCLALAMVGVSLLPFAPDSLQAGLNLPVFLLILSEQILGRWLFYRARVPAL